MAVHSGLGQGEVTPQDIIKAGVLYYFMICL